MNRLFQLRRSRIFIASCVMVWMFLSAGCAGTTVPNTNPAAPTSGPRVEATKRPIVKPKPTSKPAPKPTAKPAVTPARTLQTGTTLKVYFLDVGQADSILITSDGASMLIDAGNNADGPGVVDYLKSKGISKLDYVIGTHPHEDHIGGLDDVIDNFNIGKVIMSRMDSTTKTYRDVLAAEQNKGLTTTYAAVGTKFTFKSATFEILAPDRIGPDANENSVVLRLVFQRERFLFCGDADFLSEAAMANTVARLGETLDADVIKIGHHGSATSSAASFLRAVSPDYAVISVGADNTFGHPTQTALSAIAAVGAKVFRTDRMGTIIMSTDGKSIKVTEEATAIDG